MSAIKLPKRPECDRDSRIMDSEFSGDFFFCCWFQPDTPRTFTFSCTSTLLCCQSVLKSSTVPYLNEKKLLGKNWTESYTNSVSSWNSPKNASGGRGELTAEGKTQTSCFACAHVYVCVCMSNNFFQRGFLKCSMNVKSDKPQVAVAQVAIDTGSNNTYHPNKC